MNVPRALCVAAAAALIGTGCNGADDPAGTPSPPAATPEPAPEPTTYTVQPGDNLTTIAQRLGTSVDALVAVNDIPNPDVIQPGQVLEIPQ